MAKTKITKARAAALGTAKKTASSDAKVQADLLEEMKKLSRNIRGMKNMFRAAGNACW